MNATFKSTLVSEELLFCNYDKYFQPPPHPPPPFTFIITPYHNHNYLSQEE